MNNYGHGAPQKFGRIQRLHFVEQFKKEFLATKLRLKYLKEPETEVGGFELELHLLG